MSLLEQGVCIERELAARVQQAFDDAYGPTWRCFVGRSAGYARALVLGEANHQHILLSVGHLQLLLLRRAESIRDIDHEESSGARLGTTAATTRRREQLGSPRSEPARSIDGRPPWKDTGRRGQDRQDVRLG